MFNGRNSKIYKLVLYNLIQLSVEGISVKVNSFRENPILIFEVFFSFGSSGPNLKVTDSGSFLVEVRK